MTEEMHQRLRLSLARLEVFVATAKSGSTRAAAGRVSRSQSAASAALAELEEAFGVQLFDRVGRRLVLNERGRALLPGAVQLLDDACRLEATFAKPAPAPLRMAGSFTVGEYLLPRLIAAWRLHNPEQRVRLEISSSAEVSRALGDFDVDVGFVEGPVTDLALFARRWGADELVIIAAPGHPLTGRKVGLRQLAQARWVVRELGSGTREASDRWLGSRIKPMRIDFELGSSEAIKRIVAAGLVLGCLSRLAVAEELAGGRLVEVRSTLPPAARWLSLVVHRKRRLGPNALSFIEHCMANRFVRETSTASATPSS